MPDYRAIITALAKAYTRGQGWDEFNVATPDLEAVIATASMRLAANPGQTKQVAGPFQSDAGFTGWTLAELAVLNRYRVRAL